VFPFDYLKGGADHQGQGLGYVEFKNPILLHWLCLFDDCKSW